MKLAALPKSFGLIELKKGWFSHYFNRRENQQYIGAYPNPEYYGHSYFNVQERADFLKWYETVTNMQFDFQKEILEYCRSDVDILRKACLKFRDLLMKCTGTSEEIIDDKGEILIKLNRAVDPFHYVTIASVCMGIFKTIF